MTPGGPAAPAALPRHEDGAGTAAAPARAGLHAPNRPLFFRGWLVVAGAFVVTLVGYGAIYSHAVFAEEIAGAFGASRAAVTLIFVLSGSSCFLVSAVSGPLADRLDPRILAAGGMWLVGIGLLLAAAAQSLPAVLLGYGLLAGIGAGFAYVPAVAAVQRWFVLRRGLATGLAVSGVGVGTALVPPMAEALARLGDWRIAFVICGIAAASVGTGGALLLRHSPAALGLRPDGQAPMGVAPMLAVGAGRGDTPPGLRSRAFALAYAGTLLVSLPVTLPYALLVATARDLGTGHVAAAGLIGLVGLGSVAGRFALAALADLVGRRVTFLGCCAGLAAAMLFWGVADRLPLLQVFAVAFGALHGGLVALLPPFVADSFGSRSVGAIIGVLYTSRGIALLAGPPALALGMEAFGSHAVPLVAAAAIGVAGTALLATVPPGEVAARR